MTIPATSTTPSPAAAPRGLTIQAHGLPPVRRHIHLGDSRHGARAVLHAGHRPRRSRPVRGPAQLRAPSTALVGGNPRSGVRHPRSSSGRHGRTPLRASPRTWTRSSLRPSSLRRSACSPQCACGGADRRDQVADGVASKSIQGHPLDYSPARGDMRADMVHALTRVPTWRAHRGRRPRRDGSGSDRTLMTSRLGKACNGTSFPVARLRA